MTVKEYLENTKTEDIRKHVFCEDGFSLSTQASSFHYCLPRKTGLGKEYTHVEVACLSEKDKRLEMYEPVYADPTDEYTPCGYVPIELLETIIKEHGGIRAVVLYKVNSKKKR
jgi:hypothetical protein